MHEILLKINSATDTLIVICRKFFERIFLNFKWKQLIPSKQSSWWRRLEDVFCLCLQKTSSRHLQDEYIRLTHTSSEDVFIKTNIFVLVIRLPDFLKTSSRCLQDILKRRLAKTSLRHLQDVFKTSCQGVVKTSSRLLQDVLQKHLQDIFKTSSKRFQDVFKTSRHLQDAFETFWRRLQDVLKISWRRFCKTSWRRKKPERFQDAFKTYHQIILFLLTSFQDVFKTYSQRFWGVLQRRLSTEGFA